MKLDETQQMQQKHLYYELESTLSHCSLYRHKFTGKLVLFSEHEIKGCVCIDEYDNERVWMPCLSCKSVESLESWLQSLREEWQKKSLIPKILAQSKGTGSNSNTVMILEGDDDDLEVAVVLTGGETKGDEAIERIQEELQQNISIEWLQRAIKEEEDKLLSVSEKAKPPESAVGRERAVLALTGYQTTTNEETETGESFVGKWMRRRSDSLGSLAKSLFAFPRENYKSINESETSMSSPFHDDNDGPYTCLEDRNGSKKFAEASFAFHQAYH